jgi:CubicO group peptidase (beta-lactamase class C family)
MTTFRIARLACLPLLLLSVPTSVAARENFADTYAHAIEAFLHENFSDSNAGMVIGLLDEHGGRVFSAGKLDNGADSKVGGDTIFELGSVTKVFTALLLLEAVRRGEVHLDDPVAKYLPAAVTVPAFDGKEITLLNLAAQESGLPWHPDNLSANLENLAAKPGDKSTLQELRIASDAYTVKDMYAFLAGYKLMSTPGAGFQYSNIGMALLAHALERKTGTGFEALVVDRICAPLKMASTRITLTPPLKARLARGHWVDGTRSDPLNFQALAAAGSLLSTADDLLKFLSAQLGFTETHLTPLMKQTQAIRHTGSPQFGKTAMPWFDEGVYNPPGTAILAHGGGGFGNLAFVGFDSKKRRGVIVLTNQMKVSPYGIGWTLVQGLPLTRENITYWVREVVGIGIALDTDEKSGTARIATVFPKSPAGEAGLSSGLLLRSIAGVSVAGKSLKECLSLMGGPPGGKVRLELFDPGRNETRTVELTRQKFLTAS